MDVNFYVRDMQSVIVATDTRRQENSHRFFKFCKKLIYFNFVFFHRIAVEVGDYELCFDNSFSYQASKTVYFDVFLEDKDGSVDDLQYRDLAYRFEDAHASLEDFRVNYHFLMRKSNYMYTFNLIILANVSSYQK